MNELLYQKVLDIFKIYPRPCPRTLHGGGERWIGNIIGLPLDEVTLNDFREVLFHVFPTNYGNADVFRYLLPKSLELCFFQDDSFENLYTRDSQYSEILDLLYFRCCEWKSFLSAEEVSVLDEVFQYAAKSHFSIHQSISPFFFCLFLLWNMKVPDFSFLGEYSEIATDELREKLHDYLYQGFYTIEEVADQDYYTIDKLSVTEVILMDLHPKIPIKNKCIVSDWRSDYMLWNSAWFHKFFSDEEIAKCDGELKRFCCP